MGRAYEAGPEEAEMGVWNDRVVPHLTDAGLRSAEVTRLRERVCRGLEGRVLEIGFGSGRNLPVYPTTVTSVSAVEPSDVAWRLSEQRRRVSGIPVERAGLDGQRLAVPDASHDGGLVTFSLCTIEDPELALQEVRRVVRPGGRLHLLEHGLAPEARVRRWQHRLEPAQGRVFGGCHLTRDVPAMVRDTGWATVWTEQDYLPGPAVGRPWTYLTMGVVTAV
ncbi:class I SAM-dependent methyltransferase [Nocardioides sediminis]|uniref:class I SAM-dependent methyltransferase n=1 Tax=Nocardioides sediminis TaxID=433648 RepID=UPI001F310C97|nr:class I SAM-dependent methyltransferase [Nocardioides sediminis]